MVPQGPVSLNPAPDKIASQLANSEGLGRVRLHTQHSLGRQDQVRRLAAFRQGRPEVGGLSAGAQQTLQSSWARATKTSYGLGFRYYTEFCRRHQFDEIEANAVNLINFLQEEFERGGKQYRTLNSYRSAVSATLGTCPNTGRPVGQHPLVCRFLKGVHRLRAPKTKLFPSWDIVKVLNYLKTWGVTEKLSLRKLLMRTAFLVALVCYKRPADLINMNITPLAAQ